MMNKIVFFHRKGDSFDWETLEDVSHLRVGVNRGYLSNRPLIEAVEEGGGHIDPAATEDLNFEKLLRGRIDILPSSLQVGYYILQTRFLPGISRTVKHHPRSYLETPLYLIISKKVKNGKELIERFNRGLKQLRKTGLYDQYEKESLRGEYVPDD